MPLTKTQATVSIIAGIAALVGSGLAISSYMDKRPLSEQKQAKTYLADKYNNGEEMTWDEYQAFVKLVDVEIKKTGKLEVKDVKGEGDIKQALSDLLKK